MHSPYTSAPPAQAYTFVLTKYFPGGTEVDQQCTGQFDMPTTTAGTVSGWADRGSEHACAHNHASTHTNTA